MSDATVMCMGCESAPAEAGQDTLPLCPACKAKMGPKRGVRFTPKPPPDPKSVN